MVEKGWFAADGSPSWIGLDIGGANLKIADGRGGALSVAFELWRRPEELAAAVGSLLEGAAIGSADGVALTMTGELADCYADKSEGVRAIVSAACKAAGRLPARVAGVDDRWLMPDEARAHPHLVAAANWRLGARLVARNRPAGNGLWIDVGSTTCDLIPVSSGVVRSNGLVDTDRLKHRELVYTGVRRTPVCAVVDRLPVANDDCPVAAELFATTSDAWLLLGEVAEDAEDHATADGRPMLRTAAVARLARCVCADTLLFSETDARLAAERIAAAQIRLLGDAIDRHAPTWTVISGQGEFLARKALGARQPVQSIRDLAGATVSQTFPAHAAAVLASVEIG